MTRLVDIAEKVGTSVSTVSNVLNGRFSMVSAETRSQVLQAAKELGYRRNRHARQLRKQANMIITIQVSSQITFANTWRPTVQLTLHMLQGAASYGDELGYHIHLLIPEEGQDIEGVRRQLVAENSADGAIFIGLSNTESEEDLKSLHEELAAINMPLATIDRRFARLGVPLVSVDLLAGVAAAVEKIHAYGHHRIAYIGHTVTPVHEVVSKVEAVARSLTQKGLSLPEENVISTFGEVASYRATRALMDRSDPPTCLIYTSDAMAVAGMDAAADLGLHIPQDLSIVSFNNAPWIRAAGIPLSTIDLRSYEQGRCLAKVLMDQIRHPGEPVPATTLVASEFVERDTLGAVA